MRHVPSEARGRAVLALAVVVLALLLTSPAPVSALPTAAVVGNISIDPRGGQPSSGVGVNPATHRVYVTSADSQSVAVINSTTNTVVTTVQTGLSPREVAVNTTTNRVYVVDEGNGGAGSVTVIDGTPGSGTENQVVATITVGTSPRDIDVDSANNHIYTLNRGSGDVTVIDGITNTVTATLPVGNPSDKGIAVNSVTHRLYVASYINPINAVSVYDGSVNPPTLIDTVVISSPSAVGVDSSTNRIYVTLSAGIDIIDGLTDGVTTVLLPGQPYYGRFGVNPATHRLYVQTVGGGSNGVWVIDGASGAVLDTLAVGPPSGDPERGINTDPATNKVYLANQSPATLSVMGGSPPYIVSATIPIGTFPVAIAVNTEPTTPALRQVRVYTANWSSDDVSVIDGVTNTEITRIPLFGAPLGVAVNPVTNRVYVAYTGSDGISLWVAVIDGATNAMLPPISIPGSAFPVLLPHDGIAVNPNTNEIYVRTDIAVYVIDGVTNVVAPVAGNPPFPGNWIAVDTSANRIYISGDPGFVSVIDGVTNSYIDTDGNPGNGTTPVFVGGGGPTGMAVDPNTHKVYVGVQGTNSVAVIDGFTYAVTTIPGIPSPRGLALNPEANLLYVTDGSCCVNIIDTLTNLPAQPALPVNDGADIAVDTASNRVYAAGPKAGGVSVLGEPDGDLDGVSDSIDVTPPQPVGSFDDRPLGGTTFGQVTSPPLPPPLAPQIWELPNPRGVWAQMTGPGSATIQACASPSTSITLTTGDAAEIRCGSGIVKAYSGPIDLKFGTIPVTLPAGSDITVDTTSPGVFQVVTASSDTASIMVGGLSVSPGTSVSVTDPDGDGFVNQVDNCPTVATVWFVPMGDGDCDGLTTAGEIFAGTDPNSRCAATPLPNDEPPPDKWPFDFNNDQKANLSDVLKYSPVFNTTGPGLPYKVRFDLNGDNHINLSDVLKFSPFFNKMCTP